MWFMSKDDFLRNDDCEIRLTSILSLRKEINWSSKR